MHVRNATVTAEKSMSELSRWYLRLKHGEELPMSDIATEPYRTPAHEPDHTEPALAAILPVPDGATTEETAEAVSQLRALSQDVYVPLDERLALASQIQMLHIELNALKAAMAVKELATMACMGLAIILFVILLVVLCVVLHP